MEITVMNKKRYDELLAQIKNLETHIAVLHGQVTAMQNSNNELAEIAFDENKFTQRLMDKVWDNAERAAKDAIDIDDIASEVANNLDVSEEVARAAERLGYVDEDKVQDLIEDYVNYNNILNTDEVEEVVSDYIERNCDFIEKDEVENLIRGAVKDEVNKAIQTLINKLTAKENDHATGNYDYSLSLPRVANESQAEGNGEAAA